MTDKNTFNLDIDKDTMRGLINLIQFARVHYPFIPSEVWEIQSKFQKILESGCFKHNLICVTVKDKDSNYSTITFCPKCELDLAKKYSKEVSEAMKK